MIKSSIALFDLDRTIYNTHSFFGVLRKLVENEFLDKRIEAKILEELDRHKRGESQYSDSAKKMLHVMAQALKGKSSSELEKYATEFFEENKHNFYPYFAELLPELQKKYDVYLVTTNIQVVANVVCKMFNLYGAICTQYEVEDDKFTGRILSTLADGKHVVEVLVNKYKDSLAVGDSENDIGMLEIVRYPFCINPSPELKSVAEVRGWKITSEITAKVEILQVVV